MYLGRVDSKSQDPVFDLRHRHASGPTSQSSLLIGGIEKGVVAVKTRNIDDTCGAVLPEMETKLPQSTQRASKTGDPFDIFKSSPVDEINPVHPEQGL